MKSFDTDPSRTRQPNYNARRFAAGLALTASGITVAAGLTHDRLPAGSEQTEPAKVVHVQIKPGDTGLEIGQRLGEGNEAINEIAEQIQDQAKNGVLQPGQEVAVDASLVTDPNASEYISTNSGQ